jgi:hypothetical protein
MEEWLSTLPHCAIFGKPLLASLHIAGDFLTALSYALIPVAIAYVWIKRDFPFNSLAILFGLFITLCGLGHALSIWSMTTGTPTAYWVEGSNKILIGIISILTAMYGFYIIPRLMRIPTPAQWEEALEIIKLYRDAEKWRRFGKPL